MAHDTSAVVNGSQTPSASTVTTDRTLSVMDAVAIIVGVVVGIGIFGFPPLVASNVPSGWLYMVLWGLGGLIMLAGSLCYAELGSTYPDAGGEYAYLRRAWGVHVALLFGWARCTIIQTGAIAAVAFIFGDYAQILLPLGPHGPAIYAAAVVFILTLLNVLGSMESRRAQWVLSVTSVLALLVMGAAGLWMGDQSVPDAVAATGAMGSEETSAQGMAEMLGMLGMGMVFVLLTYGGWNEVAYLSGELKQVGRNMVRVVLLATAIIVGLYMVVNAAYLRVLGLEGLKASNAAGADMMQALAGSWAAVALSLVVCCTALGTVNACIFTGARLYFSLGRDVTALRALGVWSNERAMPVRAVWLQGAITLALIAFGAMTPNGLRAMVAYTSPVFWLFMALIALALIRLRRIDSARSRAFRVPLYPLTPIVLALVCLGLLWSSALYAGAGSWLGLVVLVAGLPLLWANRRKP